MNKNANTTADDSDEIYEKYKDHDFSKAKRAHEVPHLAKLQSEHAATQRKAGKQRVNMWLDADILEVFRHQSEVTGKGYQTLINESLRQSLTADPPLTEAKLREVLAEIKLASGNN